MATRAEIIAAVRAQYATVGELANGLIPEVEAMVDAYIRELGGILGELTPEMMVLLREEVAALAFEAAVDNAQALDMIQEAKHANVDGTDPVAYVYLGPDDNLTRPFCDSLVERRLLREQIDQLDNDQIADVWITRGGYNCRHGWFPLYGDEVEEFEQGNVAQANAAARGPQ